MIDKDKRVHEFLGEIWVDSGQVKVGDPCYEGRATSSGTITVNSGLGDGVYPAWGEMVDGVLINLFVDFDPYNSFEEKEDKVSEQTD